MEDSKRSSISPLTVSLFLAVLAVTAGPVRALTSPQVPSTTCPPTYAGGTEFACTGGSASVSVTADAGCSWSVTANQSWITVTGGSGTGSGTFVVSVPENPDSTARSGVVSGGEITYVVSQAGCAATTTTTSSTTSTSVAIPPCENICNDCTGEYEQYKICEAQARFNALPESAPEELRICAQKVRDGFWNGCVGDCFTAHGRADLAAPFYNTRSSLLSSSGGCAH